MPKKIFLLCKVVSLVGIMIIGISSQAAAFPMKAFDDRNKSIELPARPLRIISLAPTNTELLFALGLEKEIVGVTVYCNYPDAARLKEKVGSFAQFDVDRIAALKPDVILAFGTIQLPVVAELEKRGLRVFWLYPRTVKDILDSIERVGSITGAEQEARQFRESLTNELDAVRKTVGAVPADERPSVYRVMGFTPPATIGAESFQTDLFLLAGGKNAFPEQGKDFFELDAATLQKRDPDVILLCGDDENKWKQKLKASPLYRNLTAVKNDSILVLPCDLTCKPGPRIAETARRLAQYLLQYRNKMKKPVTVSR